MKHDKQTILGCYNAVAEMYNHTVRDVAIGGADAKRSAEAFLRSDTRLGGWCDILGQDLSVVRRELNKRIKYYHQEKQESTYEALRRNGKNPV